MKQSQWHEQTHNRVAYRRAGGRRRYNRERQVAIAGRRFWVAQCVLVADPKPGTQSKLARYFGVDRATITRDVRWLRAHLNTNAPHHSD